MSTAALGAIQHMDLIACYLIYWTVHQIVITIFIEHWCTHELQNNLLVENFSNFSDSCQPYWYGKTMDTARKSDW